jgi:hypothetical protein
MTEKFTPEPEDRRARMSEAEIKAFYAEMERERLLIDPDTAEVLCKFGPLVDPYRIHPDLWDEHDCVGRQYFYRRPGSDVWVEFGELPEATRENALIA